MFILLQLSNLQNILGQQSEEVMKPLTVKRLEIPSEDGLHQATNRSSTEKATKMNTVRTDSSEGYAESLKDQLEKVTLARSGQDQMDNISKLEKRLNGSLQIIGEFFDNIFIFYWTLFSRNRRYQRLLSWWWLW